jgi:death-on-curing protein
MIILSKEQVLKLHTSLIKATGGSDGIRDEGMLDGNKRLGTHVMLVFLALNGYELSYNQRELSDVILALASGNIGEKEILQWIIKHQQ